MRRREHSWITQHHQHCPHYFDKANFEPVHNMQGKQKRRLGYNIKIEMEIRRHNIGPGKGLNEDMGSYIQTGIWDPVLGSIIWYYATDESEEGGPPYIGSLFLP